MLNVRIVCVGRLKERFYLDAAAEYQKRLSRFCALEIVELLEARLPQDPSPAEVRQALEIEASAVEAKLPRGGALVALCIEGTELSSPEFAQKLSGYAVCGVSQLTFLIGGSVGLADSLKRRADLRLSMSPMTFPHHLARVMLLEQLYRAFQIQSGTRYHK
jgi:23S rRNA (pseudouridine1915-N3)-methyltransferase